VTRGITKMKIVTR